MSKELYESINVFFRNDDVVTIYRCFKALGEEKYFVQSADYYYKDHPNENAGFLNDNHLELFLEEDISTRTNAWPSLKDAIKAFDEEFE